MGKLTVKTGSTSRLEHVFILDSTSTTGAGKTGLTNASVTMHFFRPADTTVTSVTLSAGTLGTWTTGGFKEVNATDMPGVYEIGMPNAVFAATFNHSVVMIKGTGIAPLVLEYNLVAYDPLDTVRLGLTALPNTAVTTNGSLITAGTGTAQLSTTLGVALANATQWNGTSVTGMPMPTYTQPSGFLSAAFPAGTIANTTNITGGTITTVSGNVNGSVNSVTTAVTAGTVNDKTGYSLSGTQTFNVTGNITGNLSGTVGSVTGSVGSVTGSVGSVTGSVGSVTNPVTVGTINAGVITAISIATGAIDADALATDAVTEIVNAVMTVDPSTFPGTSSGYWLYEAGLNSQQLLSDTNYINSTSYVESIADTILGRNVGGGSNAGRLVKEALYALRNKSEIIGTTLSVYDAGDALSWTATVASSSSADPVTGIDP